MKDLARIWGMYSGNLHRLNGLRSQGTLCPFEAIIKVKERLAFLRKAIVRHELMPSEPELDLFGHADEAEIVAKLVDDIDPKRMEQFNQLEDSMDGTGDGTLIAQHVWVHAR